MFWNDYFVVLLKNMEIEWVFVKVKLKNNRFWQNLGLQLTREFLNYFYESTYRNMGGPKSLQNFTSQLAKLVHFCESNREVLKSGKSRVNSKDDRNISKWTWVDIQVNSWGLQNGHDQTSSWVEIWLQVYNLSL